jgi:tetraacyldisaccharide 4'-kinase
MSWRAPKFWDDPYLSVPAVLLMPVAWLYGTITHARLRYTPASRTLAPVICIGNPTLGGAGKTPVAMAIARLLAGAGRRPGFLSRGYGGKASRPILVTSESTTQTCGDEPLLLAQHYPTVVSANRVWGAETLLSLGEDDCGDLGIPLHLAQEPHGQDTTSPKPVDAIVMDDGFHNPSLEKDLSFLVIDKTAGLGNSMVFPSGPLRMPMPETLRRADALIVSGGTKADLNPEVGELIERCHRRGLPVLNAVVEPDAPTMKSLRGCPVIAYAGIGRPEKFFDTLRAARVDIVSEMAYPDHHDFTAADAETLLKTAADANATLVTTEKDAARLTGARVGPRSRLSQQSNVVPIKVRFSQPDQKILREMFKELPKRLKGKARRQHAKR